jgi:alpha-amylase/alpha-mannosidase (GH57 family)
MLPVIIHGHFYQPPRENPWTGVIDPEPDAAPFPNWNERIHSECYAPNSAAPLVDPLTLSQKLVNNYAHLNFDFGPTLLSWLERAHPQTYARILSADVESVKRRNGHGNAIAQAYAHAILPLCSPRDQRTQVRWGLADFRYRFRREAEALWLPETACNNDVLDLLIDEGMRYVILAQQQAARVRKLESESSDAWQDVRKGTVDTSRVYQHQHSRDPQRSIAVFFYDQELAGAIAFDRALESSAGLVERLARAGVSGQLVNVATDGETYGHHHKFGDLCLAHAFEVDFATRNLQSTNYGAYLDHHTPVAEVEIDNGPHGEGSSWSCPHGVGRWIRDCGCQTDGLPGWNQAWRGPLRDALDLVRDEAAQAFQETQGVLFVDPWKARDEAIELILDEGRSASEFLRRHAPRFLSDAEQMRALIFLEMQRNTVLMYASCGWFFNDIARIEPIQVMKYAARVIDLLGQLGWSSPRRRVLEILSEASSNRAEVGNGADIYRRLVETANPSYQPADVLI